MSLSIKVSNLWKRFEGKQVLRGIDLEIGAGEAVVILGPSGCGKSVLLKHMIGLMSPDEGHVEVDGTVISSFTRRELYDVRRKFGMLFQSAALFDSMTVYENVSIGLTEHTRLTETEKRSIVREKLDLVGLPDTEHLYPAELSGGMRKRVGLARAICMDPEIVLYDEPTTGLDPIIADTINELIASLQNQLNITSVVVTHDMRSAFMIADRMALLHEGRVQFVGTSAELESTDDGIVREFLSHR